MSKDETASEDKLVWRVRHTVVHEVFIAAPSKQVAQSYLQVEYGETDISHTHTEAYLVEAPPHKEIVHIEHPENYL